MKGKARLLSIAELAVVLVVAGVIYLLRHAQQSASEEAAAIAGIQDDNKHTGSPLKVSDANRYDGIQITNDQIETVIKKTLDRIQRKV